MSIELDDPVRWDRMEQRDMGREEIPRGGKVFRTEVGEKGVGGLVQRERQDQGVLGDRGAGHYSKGI